MLLQVVDLKQRHRKQQITKVHYSTPVYITNNIAIKYIRCNPSTDSSDLPTSHVSFARRNLTGKWQSAYVANRS